MPTTTPTIPTWYKSSPLWPIPQDWEILILKKLWEISSGGTPDTNNPRYRNGTINRCTPTDITALNWDKYLFDTVTKITEEGLKNSSAKILPSNSIIVCTRATIWKAVMNKNPMTTNQGFKNIIPTNVDTEFLYYKILSEEDWLKRIWNWSTFLEVSKKDFENYKIMIPESILEQQSMAKILKTNDDTINHTQNIIKKLELRNKWLQQNLLTGKIRLKGFKWDSEFHLLWKYIKEISVKNKNNQVSRILSVTNSRGFVNQSEQFEREIASLDKTNYKIVSKDQFAYNPSRVNVWSIDLLRNFDEGILSPMYVVFETIKEKLNSDFLYYHLKSHRFFAHIPMFVQGSVRDSLWFDGLSAMRFFIPSLNEQITISEILNKATQQVNQYKQKLEKLKQTKKWLMQQLLTGKVRVKVNK